MDAPDVLHHNALAWDKECDDQGEWSQPVSAEAIARARSGDWEVKLTPKRAVPRLCSNASEAALSDGLACASSRLCHPH